MVSIDSKHGELKELYKLLSDSKNHKPITTATKNCKNNILNNVNQLYNKYFERSKKQYRPVETGGAIDNDSDKKKKAEECKLV